MKRADFENGFHFTIKEAEGVHRYKNNKLEVLIDDTFCWISSIIEVSSVGFNVESKFMNRPISTYILFKNCKVV